MKDFVMWVMLACFFFGLPMFFIGRFIEKGQDLMEIFMGERSQSKLGERLCWSGMALVALGFVLIFFVMPKL